MQEENLNNLSILELSRTMTAEMTLNHKQVINHLEVELQYDDKEPAFLCSRKSTVLGLILHESMGHLFLINDCSSLLHIFGFQNIKGIFAWRKMILEKISLKSPMNPRGNSQDITMPVPSSLTSPPPQPSNEVDSLSFVQADLSQGPVGMTDPISLYPRRPILLVAPRN